MITEQNYMSEGESGTGKLKPSIQSKTPYLDSFGRDLTKLAMQNKLDSVIGRDIEIEQLAQIINKKSKNNPILVGLPGAGKTCIVEGLAVRVVNKQIDSWLFNKRIIELNITSVVSGTKYRGEFEQRMEDIIKEVKNNPDIILFIDEIHNIIGAGGASGSMDAANIIKPALSRGELRCIGATTVDEYKKVIENDSALDRRFQKVFIKVLNKVETKQVLMQIKSKYENFHRVNYSEDIIDLCVEMSDRYITYKNFPDKAIDLLDEVGSRVKISNTPEDIKKLEIELKEAEVNKKNAADTQNYEAAANFRNAVDAIKKSIENKVNELKNSVKIDVINEDVAKIVSMHTGIPLNKLTSTENSKLINLEKLLKEKIIGQNEAVSKVVDAVQRSMVGISDPGKPRSFMFMGPTGTGKTLLAKVLSDYLFDTDESFIRFDMSEYSEASSVSKLVGSPPGYIGFENKGKLTEAVKTRPYSLLLFDEIEKADPSVFNILLQVLDDGILTDSYGTEVNFKNTIIVFTSNVGTDKILNKNKLGFSANDDNKNSFNEDVILGELKKKFSPEFINRLDDKLCFKTLTTEDVLKIIDLEIQQVIKRIENKGYSVVVENDVKKFLAENGYTVEFGARPLKRAIVQNIESPVAKFILNNNPKQGSALKLKFLESDKCVAVSLVLKKSKK